MTIKQLPFESYLGDHDQPFSGWDFGFLTRTSRMQEFPLPWSYYNLVKPYIKEADSLLDMGTGGGEFLSTLAPLPTHTYATEAYAPNIAVASSKLAEHKVTVVPIQSDDRLPLETESFQLIINRHEAFNVPEVKRLLKPGGMFITQQVGGHNDIELSEALDAPMSPYLHWTLESACSPLTEAGLQVEYSNEVKTKTRFYDLGALIYYAKVIEWQIPDFSVGKYEAGLRKLYHEICEQGFIDLTCHRFIIAAAK